jgi:hypothetical protein
MTKTPKALEYFRRYAKFYLGGLTRGDKDICWRVEATDSISMPGILQITAVEYYANETTDDVKHKLVDGLVIQPVNPNDEVTESKIEGFTFIKPKIEYKYFYRGKDEPQWSVIGKNIPVKITQKEGKKLALVWTSSYHGQFVIKCNDIEKTIVVESLF